MAKLSIIERIKILEKLSDENKCDGNCNIKSPYISCKGCEAAKKLNLIGELLDEE